MEKALYNTFYLAHDYVIIIQQNLLLASIGGMFSANLICRLLDDAW